MVARRRVFSIILVAVIAGGGALYAYFGTVRLLPVLLVTVDIRASDPGAQRIPFDLGDHCDFNSFNDWGELQTRYRIPSGVLAALFLTVPSWPDGVSSAGTNPQIIYMTESSLVVYTRSLPHIALFTLELRDGQFLIAGESLLRSGESARHVATYNWIDDAGTIQVTEEFTFSNLGFTPMRQLTRAYCL